MRPVYFILTRLNQYYLDILCIVICALCFGCNCNKPGNDEDSIPLSEAIAIQWIGNHGGRTEGVPVTGIYLNKNQFSQEEKMALVEFVCLLSSHLKALWLRETNVNDEDLLNLQRKSDFRHLQELVLYDTKVTSAAALTLGNFNNLRLLDLGRCNVELSKMAPLIELSHLRTLNMFGASVDDEGLKILAEFKELREFVPYFSELDDLDVMSSQKIDNLLIVHLTGTLLTDRGLKELEQFKSVKIMELPYRQFSERAIESLRRSLPNTRFKNVE